jgi:hypothetical protein
MAVSVIGGTRDAGPRQLLLERVDGARRRSGEKILPRFGRLDVRCDVDAERHLLVAKMGDKPVGGLFPMSGPDFAGTPEQWMAYLAVDDVDAR